jgi:hypothetical protein
MLSPQWRVPQLPSTDTEWPVMHGASEERERRPEPQCFGAGPAILPEGQVVSLLRDLREPPILGYK